MRTGLKILVIGSAALLAGFLLPGTLHSATVLKLSTAEMTERADRILHGKIVSAKGRKVFGPRNAAGVASAMIVTDYVIELSETWKGETAVEGVTSNRAKFSQPGGVLGGQGTYIAGAARFKVGEEVVVFLDKPNEKTGAAFTIGLAQGKYHVELDSAKNKKMVSRTLDEVDLVDALTLNPAAPHENTRRPLTSLRGEVTRCLDKIEKQKLEKSGKLRRATPEDSEKSENR